MGFSTAVMGSGERARAGVEGAGLGLRRALLQPLSDHLNGATPETGDSGSPARVPDFLEVAPENWMHLDGRLARRLREFTERFPFVTHGLSLDLGGIRPLDHVFLQDLKSFLDVHGIADYTEHLSACGDSVGHLYDLMPLPFTGVTVRRVAARIREVQSILERRIAVENVSYYLQIGGELDEASFITAVLEEADCDLLLDVNNVVVNSINHGYDAEAFIAALPLNRVRYLHLAGHDYEAPDLRVDTHGEPVGDEAWALLDKVYQRLGAVPTVLERDFNFPPLAELLAEVDRVALCQVGASSSMARAEGAGRRFEQPVTE